VAECLAHLNLTSKSYFSLITMAIENARLDRWYGSAPYRMDWKGYLLWWLSERHGRFKMKTTERFRPLSVEPVSHILPEFLFLQDRLIECLYRANGLALNRIKITSPFDARLQYNLYSCFRLLPAHQRRHLWQAAQARSAVTAGAASRSELPWGSRGELVGREGSHSSSPRVWGTHFLSFGSYFFYRFIPTRVGNTTYSKRSRVINTVHPHACGEHTS
jgi:DinB superfamily